MTCSEFKENVAAFAVGALGPDERALLEAHLAETVEHEGCREELRRANEAAALLAASAPPIRPGEHVWDAIAARIAGEGGRTAPGAADAGAGDAAAAPAERTARVTAVRPGGRARGTEAGRPPGGRRERGRSWREGVAWTLAAAAAVAAVFLGVQRGTFRERLGRAQQELALSRGELSDALDRLARVEEEQRDRFRTVDLEREACLRDLQVVRASLAEKETALELLGAPETRLVQLAAQGDVPYRASALLNPPREEALVLASALAPQPGKDYQLWLIRGDRKISAGLLPTDESGLPTLARISPELLAEGAPDALAITVEPAGGMPQPTGPIVLVGKVA